MITCKHTIGAVSLAIALLAAVACDSGSPSRTSDDIAADSALAADLALANRDTLLVDSIGEYRPADAAERVGDSIPLSSDSVTLRDVTPTGTTPSSPAPSPDASGSPPPGPPPRTLPPVTAAPSPAATKPTARAPNRAAANVPSVKGARACNVSGQANQTECVKVTLAATDQRLNRIYRALITETRRQEGTPRGAKDPPSVQRLRVAQRAWLVYRDTECRRRGRGKEGALWARPRVKCLGEFSVRRTNQLADNFSRLTAH